MALVHALEVASMCIQRLWCEIMNEVNCWNIPYHIQGRGT